MTKTKRIAFVHFIRPALAIVLGACLAGSHGAFAQNTPQPVDWEFQVVRDGQQIDSFSATTNVGQARTDTHHNIVQNRVGCAETGPGCCATRLAKRQAMASINPKGQR